MYTQETTLDGRKQKILKAVVDEHVQTAEPVGSEALAHNYDFGVKPATIRNEMAEMADMGYLRQPHTSAGRVPSDLGYRFYVDRLMGVPTLTKGEAILAWNTLTSAGDLIDSIISQICRILSHITQYTSVATQPAANNTIICHIGLSKVTGQKMLLVVVLSDGRVEHRLFDAGHNISRADAAKVSVLLASELIGKSIDAVGEMSLPGEHSLTALWNDAISALRIVAESLEVTESQVYVEGWNCILRQPEFQDLARLESVLAALEERRWLYQVLSRAMLGSDVTIIIGTENPFYQMQDTSFVASKYKVGDRVVGTIGVLGPTRMNYRRAVAAVESMASNLSELLTVLSLS